MLRKYIRPFLQMKYIDCFAGTGSMSLALHPFLGRLIAYCEIDPAAQAVLKHNMNRGLLPKAPIINDVRNISRTSMNSDIDAMTASWPCVGHSNRGLKEGLSNSQSSLFHEIIRISEEFDLKMLFLENVRSMLSYGGHQVLQALAERGYDLQYVIMPACAVGSPQRRERWFCIALKQSFSFNKQLYSGPKFQWNADEGGIARMIPAEGKAKSRAFVRSGILGNALVPDQVKLAFLFLLTGTLNVFGQQVKISTEHVRHVPAGLPCKAIKQVNLLPSRAVVVQGMLYRVLQPTFKLPPIHIELRADNFQATVPISPLLRTELVTTLTVKKWETPRKSMTGACNVLTKRSVRDLPTMLRFSSGTSKEMAKGIMNPDWVEHLMGFPLGWTDF